MARMRALYEAVDGDSEFVISPEDHPEIMAALRAIDPAEFVEKPYPDGGKALVACVTCRGRRKIVNPKTFSGGHASSCGWAKAGFGRDLSSCTCAFTIWCPECHEESPDA